LSGSRSTESLRRSGIYRVCYERAAEGGVVRECQVLERL
jgi:hypothetical protein